MMNVENIPLPVLHIRLIHELQALRAPVLDYGVSCEYEAADDYVMKVAAVASKWAKSVNDLGACHATCATDADAFDAGLTEAINDHLASNLRHWRDEAYADEEHRRNGPRSRWFRPYAAPRPAPVNSTGAMGVVAVPAEAAE